MAKVVPLRSTKCTYCPNITAVRRFSTLERSWRSIFEEQAKKNNLSGNDWYKIHTKTLDERASLIVAREFNGSMYRALTALFPETEWHPWKFEYERVPKGFWKHMPNQRKYFDSLAKELGIQTLDDWYQKLSNKILQDRLLSLHNGSPVGALMAAYPEHNWMPWKFQQVPDGYWKPIENQRAFFNWLGKELGVKELDDWYHKISIKVLLEAGGRTLLDMYHGSPMAALMAAYPEHNWVQWSEKMKEIRPEMKKQKSQQSISELKTVLEAKNMTQDEWYQTSLDALDKNAAEIIDREFHGSIYRALCTVFPEIEWHPWKFKYHNVPREYWKDQANQRKFFDDLGKQLGIQSLDEWYDNISAKLVQEKGGASIVVLHNGSAIGALMAAYPEHNWIPWKFKTVPAQIWSSKDNVSQFLAHLSEKLSIQTLDDWYRVDWKLMEFFGAAPLLARHKGLYNLLKEQYPHHPWDPKRFNQSGKKAQRWLAVTLKKLFPDEEILEDYMHPKVVLPSSNRPLQLDVYIPSKSLAFEYQGQQHFEEVEVFSPTRTYQRRDEEKRTLCAANNIKLIEVPYWWNRTREQLEEMIEAKK